MKDKRYTIGREYCGYTTRRYVVRYCGQFICSKYSRQGAEHAAQDHKEARTKLLIGDTE